MPFNWSIENEKYLLIAVIKAADVKPTPAMLEEIALKLGGGANANGCGQKFYKLKREAEALMSGTNGGAAPETPKKAAKNATPRSSAKKRGSKDANADDAGDDDPVAGDTPAKKRRVKKAPKEEVKKEEATVKTEEVEEDAEDAEEAKANEDDEAEQA